MTNLILSTKYVLIKFVRKKLLMKLRDINIQKKLEPIPNLNCEFVKMI